MTTLAALIVDDEPHARRALERLVAITDGVEVAGSAADGVEALAAMASMRVDLLLADIAMPRLAGLELVDRLDVHDAPAVVFVTAYAEHAVCAFDLGVADYLLKPVAPERFGLAVSRARKVLGDPGGRFPFRQLIRSCGAGGGPAAPEHLWCHAAGGRSRVAVGEVEAVRAEGDYVRLVMADGRSRLTDGPLDRLAVTLSGAGFLRVHRSTLIRLDAVHAVRSDPSRRLILELRSGEVVTAGRRATPQVRAMLRQAVGDGA